MSKVKNYGFALTSLILAGGLVAGCGSSPSNKSQGNSPVSNTASTSNASSTSRASTSSSGNIIIAVAAPFSGTESFIGPDTLNGVKVAAAEINANGGVLGRQIQIVTADTAGDPVDAVPAITQVMASQHPAGMIGPSSLTITAVINQLNQDKMVDMPVGGTTQLDNMNYPYIFRVTPSDSQMGVGMAYYGTTVKGYKRAALVFGSNSSAQTLVPPVQQTLTKHGVNIVANIQVVPDQSSYRSEIERILVAKPDVIYTQLDPQSASTFFSELQQLGGGKIPLIGDDVTASAEFAKAIGLGYANKELTSVQGSSVGGAGASDYTNYYAQVYNGQKPVILSNNGYDALNIIALAMTEAKSIDPAVYVNNMMKVANGPGTDVYDYKTAIAALTSGAAINYQGASGPEDFNQYHNVTGAFEADGFTSTGSLAMRANITPEQLLGY